MNLIIYTDNYPAQPPSHTLEQAQAWLKARGLHSRPCKGVYGDNVEQSYISPGSLGTQEARYLAQILGQECVLVCKDNLGFLVYSQERLNEFLGVLHFAPITNKHLWDNYTIYNGALIVFLK